MANMLQTKATKWIGCCSRCARKSSVRRKPGRMARHQARAAEKRQWSREARES